MVIVDVESVRVAERKNNIERILKNQEKKNGYDIIVEKKNNLHVRLHEGRRRKNKGS